MTIGFYKEEIEEHRRCHYIPPQQPPFLWHIPMMARPTYCVPAISRPVVAALYHEARRHRLPMTRFLDQLLKGSHQGTPRWHQASLD